MMRISTFLTKIFFLIFFFFSLLTFGQEEFITIWQTDNPGISDDDQITIPATGSFSLEWEHLSSSATGSEPNNFGETTITFPEAGTYIVKITPNYNAGNANAFHRIKFNDDEDKEKLLEITQWGDIEWSSLENAYYGCENLEISADDIPDLNNVESTKWAFGYTNISTVPNMNDWDMSNVKNMSRMFQKAEVFNQDISNWDVSNVNNMKYMFAGTANSTVIFNQDISNWDVSNVINMEGMFWNNTIFNQDIGSWDVSNVTNMQRMFENSDFNQDIGNWDVSNVTNMQRMFDNSEFNQDIGNWDVSDVTNMREMFENSEFNQDIGNWDVSNVTNMQYMFAGSEFNQDIGNWDVSDVTTMRGMFENSEFNQDIGNWDVSNVTSMQWMFENSEFNQDIGNWDVSNVTSMQWMFSGSEFNQDIGNWEVSNVTNMQWMFENSAMDCENYSLTLQAWADNPNTASNIDFSSQYGMEYSPEIQDAIDYLENDLNWDISGHNEGNCYISEPTGEPFITVWNTDGDTEITIPASGEFQYTWEEVGNPSNTGSDGGLDETTIDFGADGEYEISIYPAGNDPFHRIEFDNSGDKNKIIDIVQWGDIEWSSFENAYYGCENLEISADDIPDLNNVESTKWAFGYTNISTVPNMNDWDMSNVENMSRMFQKAEVFNQDISSWDVSNVIDMEYMFAGNSSSTVTFNQDISNWDVSNVINMEGMFWNNTTFNQDIGNWDVSNVTDMSAMFENSEFNQDIGNWEVSNVTDMWKMFANSEFNQDIGNWDVSNATYMQNMFRNSKFNQDIGSWDVSKVENMNYMFYQAGSFNQELSHWQLNNLAEANEMFSNSNMSCENLSLTLHTWTTNPALAENVEFANQTNMEYSPDIIDALDYLENDLNWEISGLSQGSCSLPDLPDPSGEPFISTWDTENSTKITLPAYGQFQYTWEEVGNSSNTGTGVGSGETVIDFGASGEYELKIYPTGSSPFHRINFENSIDRTKIQDISQWGEVEWSSFKYAFYLAFYLEISADDIPDLSNVTNMSYAFAETNMTDINNLNDWDVSNITDMSYLFAWNMFFNDNVESWDVSNVENMDSMFSEAEYFNQNIGNWDVSNVTNMDYMLSYMQDFNQDISNWDVSNVTSMNGMFANSGNFNQDINGWDVSKVESMEYMFSYANNFDQNLENWELNSLDSAENMFNNSGVSCENYSLTLFGWANNSNTPSDISFGALSLEYSPDIDDAIDYLENNLNWEISGHNQGSCAVQTAFADLSFTKEVDLSTAELGDELTYTFTIENTGDLDLQEVEITDNDLDGLSSITYDWPNNEGELAVGETATATATYTVTQDDVDNGSVENLAFVNAKDENDEDLEETESTDNLSNPGKPGETGVPTVTTIIETLEADLSFTKEVDLSTAELGDELTYTFTIENTGDLDLQEVEITDNDLDGLSSITYDWPNNEGELAVGETTTATATYTVTQDDVDNGSVENLAFVNAKDENDEDLEETESTDDLSNPGKPGETGAPTITTIIETLEADLSFTKEVDLSTAELGDELTYTFTIENTGDLDLQEVEITDNDLDGLSSITYDWPNNEGELAVGETATATATYTVTQDDVDNGSVENLAFVNAKDENDEDLEETESTDDLSNPGKPGETGVPTVTIIIDNPVVGTPFVTIWNTGNPGASGNGQIIIPATGEYNYTWENLEDSSQQGSGSADGSIVLSLPALGEFKLTITPIGTTNPFHKFSFNNGGDKMKLISVESWGTTEWSSLENAFYGAENLSINATDIPDFSNVSNMSYAFASTGISEVSGIENWEVDNVTNMSSIFENATEFNTNINSWEVSNVITLDKAFKGANSFNQELNDWTVDNVISMEAMFENATSFNQSLSNWNIENVNNITAMFKNAESFDQNIESWNVSQITDMTDLFNGATNFNQSLNAWEVSSLTKMTRTFANTEAFDQPLNDWDVSDVTNMNQVFENATAFNQNLSSWNTSSVNRMKAMFANTQNFDQDLSNWNVSQVLNMESMFENANNFNHSLEEWNLNSLENAEYMLDNSSIDCLNYSNTLKTWAENFNSPTGITIGAEGMEFSSQVVDYRNTLIADLGWNIIGDTEGSCMLSVDSETEVVIEVYPNPTKDFVYIDNLQEVETIKLFDFNGRIIKNIKVQSQTESIDLTEFASGVYYLKMTDKNQSTITKKIIKHN